LSIDSSGNVGINTTSVSTSNGGVGKLFGIKSSANNIIVGETSGSGYNGIVLESRKTGRAADARLCQIGMFDDGSENGAIRFSTAPSGSAISERMRIDSSGNVLVGATSNPGGGTSKFVISGEDTVSINNTSVGTGTAYAVYFKRNATGTGSITVTGSNTAYNTSSDYRLKENIAPMTGALATVQQLNPVTYNWKLDGSAGQGFIAHELQAVVPDCVTGEKDAVETYVDEEGVEQTRPVYQGIDTSFLVATLTAAIKELSAKNDALEARIAALEGANNVSA
jgi:hypothetical protein